MLELSEEQMLEKLERFSTPTVSNIVAAHPERTYCLGLYDAWKEGWYTDQSVHCVFPEMGVRVGYAFTLVVSVPESNFPSLPFTDIIEALHQARKPSILVCQQEYPPEILDRAGLFGDQSTSLFKACGVTGVVTNGPSRDVDGMRGLGIQYIMSGITPAHGVFSYRAVNVPVSVAGMDVSPGEIVHMDENGACKFPAEKLVDICNNIDAQTTFEEERSEALLSSKTPKETKRAWLIKSGDFSNSGK